MLCLSRHHDEAVIIDLRKHGLGLVRVSVNGIHGDKVKLGFASDKSIPIHREEVHRAIERETNAD